LKGVLVGRTGRGASNKTASNRDKMPTIMIPFDEFVDNFLDNDSDKAKKYEAHKDEDDNILLTYKDDDREDTMCNILWRIDDTEKWKRMRYNGSSPFAFWFCQYCDEDSDADSD